MGLRRSDGKRATRSSFDSGLERARHRPRAVVPWRRAVASERWLQAVASCEIVQWRATADEDGQLLPRDSPMMPKPAMRYNRQVCDALPSSTTHRGSPDVAGWSAYPSIAVISISLPDRRDGPQNETARAVERCARDAAAGPNASAELAMDPKSNCSSVRSNAATRTISVASNRDFEMR